jgi:hypothetical protein
LNLFIGHAWRFAFFFLAAFCWLAADHGDAQGDGFRNRSWAYQSSARKGATDHRRAQSNDFGIASQQVY